MFTCERTVMYSEVARDKVPDEAQIVRYFQDCSIMHSEACGVGVDYLGELGKAWLLISWQLCYDRKPKLGERIMVSTWPYAFDTLYGYRNFTMRNVQGELLAWANSLWVMVNMKTGRFEKLTPQDTDPYAIGEKLPMTYAPRKIRLPKEYTEMTPYPVHRFDVDTNGHVNNVRYIDLAMEYVPEDVHITQIRVEYKRAALYGERIFPRVHRDGSQQNVVLCDEKGHTYAAAEFTLQSSV